MSALETPTWPEHAMTADELKALRREHWADTYAGTLDRQRQAATQAYITAQLRERQRKAAWRRAYLKFAGLIIGGLMVPIIVIGLCWLIA